MAKTVLIMGASNGFGKDAALVFTEQGWNVSATMRTAENAEACAKPEGFFTPKIDVTDRASMKLAFDQTIHQFGRIDVLVNNAGFALMGPWREHRKNKSAQASTSSFAVKGREGNGFYQLHARQRTSFRLRTPC